MTIPQKTSTAQALGDLVAKRPAAIATQPVEERETAVALTVITGDNAVLTKTYGVGHGGAPAKVRSAAVPAKATAERVRLSGGAGRILQQLASLLTMLTNQQAIVLAPPPPGNDKWSVVPSRAVGQRTDVIAKTQTNFATPAGRTLLGLDFDVRSWPPDLRERVAQHPEQLTGILRSVFPDLGSVAFVMRASVSSSITSVQGKSTGRNSGQHRYYVALDGRDVADFARRLHERLVLAGWAYGMITGSGLVLVRSLIDVNATQDLSRIWYEADALLADDRLRQDARKPVVKNDTGGFLDTRKLAALSDHERERLNQAEASIRQSKEAEARPIREAWRAKREQQLIARGVPPGRAAKVVGKAIDVHELTGDFVIDLDDGSAVSVDDILDDPKRYHEATCPDPLEPEYGGGRNKAILYTDSNPARIYSHAHGGIHYHLLRTPEFWFETPAEEQEGEMAAPVATDAGGWPEPVDIFGQNDPVDLTTPPEGSLPELLAAWSRSEARRKGVSEAFAAAAALGVASAAIGSSLEVQVREHDHGWTEPASLWVALVAEPGRAKSPTISAAVQPLRTLDSERYRADKPKHDAWAAATKVRNRKPSAPDPGPEPVIRRTVVDDVTFEQQTRIHAANPRGLLRAPDELFGFFGSFGAYKQKADGDRTQALRLFEGREITIDRVGAGSIRAENALMAIVAGTQPEKIGRLARDLGADGMLQRFLFVVDDGAERQGVDERPDDIAIRNYSAAVRHLADATYLFPEPLRLTSDAYQLLASASTEISKLRAIPGMSAAWKGHVEKWGKFLPRIVLSFHCLDRVRANGTVDPNEAIGANSAERAILYARFLLRHQLRFYQLFFAPDEANAEARGVAGYLLTRPDIKSLNHRTIYDARKELRGDSNLRLRLRVMQELEVLGWVRVEKRDANGPTTWTVNPSVHVRFAERAAWERKDRERKRSAIVEAGEARKWLVADSMSGITKGNAS